MSPVYNMMRILGLRCPAVINEKPVSFLGRAGCRGGVSTRFSVISFVGLWAFEKRHVLSLVAQKAVDKDMSV